MPNRCKQLLQQNKPAFGLWAGLGDALVVEAASRLDLDWLLIDCEHGAPSHDDCLALLQAMGSSETTPIVRLASPDAVAIKRLLDMGAQGILVPQIESADQVRRMVAASKYPPTGTRGIGPYRAAGSDFAGYFARANDETLVVVQIETRGAVEELDEIVAVDGLDGVLIGPADLSASLGRFPETRHPDVEEVVARVLAAAQKAGKAAGYFCASGKEARERAAQGFTLLNVCSDFALITRGLQRELASARQTPEAD